MVAQITHTDTRLQENDFEGLGILLISALITPQIESDPLNYNNRQTQTAD